MLFTSDAQARGLKPPKTSSGADGVSRLSRMLRERVGPGVPSASNAVTLTR